MTSFWVQQSLLILCRPNRADEAFTNHGQHGLLLLIMLNNVWILLIRRLVNAIAEQLLVSFDFTYHLRFDSFEDSSRCWSLYLVKHFFQVVLILVLFKAIIIVAVMRDMLDTFNLLDWSNWLLMMFKLVVFRVKNGLLYHILVPLWFRLREKSLLLRLRFPFILAFLLLLFWVCFVGYRLLFIAINLHWRLLYNWVIEITLVDSWPGAPTVFAIIILNHFLLRNLRHLLLGLSLNSSSSSGSVFSISVLRRPSSAFGWHIDDRLRPIAQATITLTSWWSTASEGHRATATILVIFIFVFTRLMWAALAQEDMAEDHTLWASTSLTVLS